MIQDSRSFLRQIYPESGDARDAVVDIVAVHGLDPINKKGHAYNTWTDGDKLWLRDFLPMQPGMPKLRVLLFGYNSSAAFATSTVGVAGAAINLLDQLRFKRSQGPERPLVFCCHSLGGIVVKQAMVEAHNADDIHGPILKWTKGIAFFGTPHSGGHGARLGDSIVHVIQALTGNVRNDIMEWLRADSFLSNHLAENFARRAKNMRIINFMESLRISDKPFARHFGLVVPPSSSSLNWPERETKVLMEASHTTICKFSSADDELYIRVADHLLELITWAAYPQNTTIPNIAVDVAPPPYEPRDNQSPLGPAKEDDKQVKIKYDTDETDDTDDSSDGEKLNPGWLDRIRAASPFRERSPRTDVSTRKGSDAETPSPETQNMVPVWPIVMLPYPKNPSYIHRADTWNQIVALMNRSSPIFLQGVGGCGKTQQAVYLSHWFRDKNPESSILFINANSPENALSGLGLIASRMGIRNTEDEASRLLILKSELERPRSEHWLMIFDSVDDIRTYDAVKPYIPRCTEGQVIFTSRRDLTVGDIEATEFALDLSTMSAFEAAAMMHESLKGSLLKQIDPPDMDELLRQLDYLPLAITQAAAFMNQTSTSLKLYLAKISDDSLLAEQLSMSNISENYSSGLTPAVYSTFKLSFNQLISEQPDSIRVLSYLSFLESRAVPRNLLDAILASETLSESSISGLTSYSFARWRDDRTYLDSKRLVQVAVQRWLRETDQWENVKTAVLRIMSENFPEARFNDLWHHGEAWLPHALKLLEICERDIDRASIESPRSEPSETGSSTMPEFYRAVAQLKAKVGLCYYRNGEWTVARDFLEEALDNSRQNFGTMDDLTLHIQGSLIQTLRYLGYIKIANVNARDLKRARKARGNKDKLTFDSYRIYSLTLQDLGKWKEAREAADKGLAGYRELYKSDPTNPDILHLCRRTAMASIALGQYQRAETLLQETLDAYGKRNEAESEPAANCEYAIAVLQCQIKQFSKAEITAGKCETLRKAILKRGHPDILKAQYIIGVALSGQKRWDEAETLLNKVLVQAQARPGVGKKHIYSLVLLYTLASVEEGRAVEDEAMLGEGAGRDAFFKAKALLTEVLTGRIESYGPEHLDTLTAKAKLAGVELALGNRELAEREAQQILKLASNKENRRAGVRSAAIAWMCLSTLTGCAQLRAQEAAGREKEVSELRKSAASYAKQLADAMEKILGTEHPDTVTAGRAWIGTLLAMGDTKTAAKARQRFGVDEHEEPVSFAVTVYRGLPAH